jgi:hypothetical protein
MSSGTRNLVLSSTGRYRSLLYRSTITYTKQSCRSKTNEDTTQQTHWYFVRELLSYFLHVLLSCYKRPSVFERLYSWHYFSSLKLDLSASTTRSSGSLWLSTRADVLTYITISRYWVPTNQCPRYFWRIDTRQWKWLQWRKGRRRMWVGKAGTARVTRCLNPGVAVNEGHLTARCV